MADHPPQLTGTKTCRTCQQTKPVIAFDAARENRDGLRNDCRACHGEKTKKQPSSRKRREAQGEAATRRALRNRNFLYTNFAAED